MNKKTHRITRRDFVKGVSGAAVGVALGLPAVAEEIITEPDKSRVVLIRDAAAVDAKGKINGEVIQTMLDQAVMKLFDKDDPVACFKSMIKPHDNVGIKTNVWEPLPTTTQVEQAIKRRVMDAGVPEERIGIDDRGVLNNPLFKKATALINARPMRTHAWSGVGSLIKNYIMFDPNPPNYHDNSCAPLATLWDLPAVKGKTRLNVLVLLTPLFHGVGPHHFDTTYVWTYGGLAVGTDPVAVDSVGLRLFNAKRKEHFNQDKPIKPAAHHIAFADTRYKLGNADPSKIELIKLGWEEGALI
ncbi:MAG: twin-arginine translocation signal domain-containing protein [candidate division Zixibacteria bacterium]|nr:twin-arginine translocation signal domain-containing protein [candidate division Zixibacteria bacterium]MDH3939070.1 twin-arginine translocation signal domain-containing protein [candidate division Zixibacteria bacterium]MDH4033603.1 twin-arginine translocation signal domain-containing protein [candidate division Zixibacteria bacterium]